MLWRVDVYYSGFTTVKVKANSEQEALELGRTLASHRLSNAILIDTTGNLAQLIQSLKPWEECDTAEQI